MTLSTFQHNDGDFDTSGLQLKNTTPNDPTNAALTCGSESGKFGGTYRGMFHVFELTGIPANAIINGVMIEWTAHTTRIAWVDFLLKIGFMEDDGIWSNGGGMSLANYPTLDDLQWAEFTWGFGFNNDSWVDHLGPGATVADLPASTAGVKYSVGDGTGVTPTDTAAGLTAHMQLSIDEVAVDNPFVCLQVYRTFTGNVTRQFLWRSNDHGTTGDHPILHVDWTAPPPTSSFVVVPQSHTAGGTMEVTINGTFLDSLLVDIGAATTWTSSIAGLLTTGTNLVEQDLVVGAHVITVVATDSALETDTTIFTITVFDVPDDMGNAIRAATVGGDPNSSLQIAGEIGRAHV